MRQKVSFLFFFFLSCQLSFSQDQVEIHISEIDSDIIAQATFDQDEYALWAERLYNEVEKFFKADTTNFEVALLFTVDYQGADIQYSSRPFGKDRNLDLLIGFLSEIPPPTVKYLPYSFVMIARINQGSANDHIFEPEFTYAEDWRLNQYKHLTINHKQDHLQGWISDEVLPMVAYYESIVDSTYKGVRAIGQMVTDGLIDSYEVADLTDYNTDYWNAVLEMSPGYQIIPFTKICLHILVGEYAKAVRLLRVISLFSNEDSLPFALHNEFNNYLTELLVPLKSSIDDLAKKRRQEGTTASFDHIEEIFERFPRYPQAQLEHAFTHITTEDEKEKRSQWQVANGEIKISDPLFHPRFYASSKEESYQFARSKEASGLFEDEANVRKDLVKYADIALDCEDYALAGHLYWLILNYFDKEKDYDNRDMLAHFLYCMNALGHEEIIAKFKGDFTGKFKLISKERKQLKKKHPAYKDWKKSK